MGPIWEGWRGACGSGRAAIFSTYTSGHGASLRPRQRSRRTGGCLFLTLGSTGTWEGFPTGLLGVFNALKESETRCSSALTLSHPSSDAGWAPLFRRNRSRRRTGRRGGRGGGPGRGREERNERPRSASRGCRGARCIPERLVPGNRLERGKASAPGRGSRSALASAPGLDTWPAGPAAAQPGLPSGPARRRHHALGPFGDLQIPLPPKC